MKHITLVKSLALGLALSALGLAGITKAQTMQNDATHLDAKQRSIAEVAALTARGDLEKLSPALAKGLDAGLTINELKEVLVQMYAYTGFPRSLNGLQTLITVTENRRQSGIADKTGKDATPLPADLDRDKYGAETRARLTGKPPAPVTSGPQAFAPIIDTFLKEHLFADIFARDILGMQSREIATVAALCALGGVDPQLRAHLGACMNVGTTRAQIEDLIATIEPSIGKPNAANARRLLNDISPKAATIFPPGDKGSPNFFTGNVAVRPLTKADGVNKYSVGNVVFSPSARTNWHTHPDGQILLAIAGRGCYQERGKPVRWLGAGDVVNIPAGVEHWHGAAPGSEFTHIALSNEYQNSAVTWMKPVTDEEYKTATSKK
ncbi:4-carboxymuconolactone decarboxylase [Ereboglobus sp. PH5-5]|uniref:carboxymuconolactone decarboxylase family protein n=1 Tax=Ereboglobus sp. PH5-5 TaxID=2940529 RepID=UPI0024053FBA|nr:carboxymuconolactone decarboxylase family protein [Ereboglobus sp. PH5-5]MDF9832255.1 4-carboxymuconolactone decarboxylase [Ereboglobus sp. PH5-5]